MAVLWILVFSLSFAFSHAVASVSRDAMLLLSFKSSISLDPASLLSDWNLSTNHCHWYGVTCDRFSGRLRILSIPHNVFSGEIPADVAKLHKLEILQLQGNNFSGRIPDQISSLLSLRMLNLSYNVVSGQIPDKLIGSGKLRVIDLSNNQLSGEIGVDRFSECEFLVHLKLSHNFLTDNIPAEIGKCWNLRTLLLDSNIFEGRIPAEIGRISQLRVLDVSRNRNRLSGSLPGQLGMLKDLKWILLGGNNLTGEIPSQLGQLTSLIVLDLSRNGLTGSIPENLTNATNLEIVLLNHNRLVGEIPSSFSTLSSLTELDVSFNNLSGHIPQLQHLSNCDFFKGNQYLHPCLDPYSAPPDRLPDLLEVHKEYRQSKLKSFVIAMVASASFILFILLVMVLVLILGRRKISRLTSLRRKVVVTFADAPTEVNYDNVVRATGNFSIRNLIGTGGFGSTYKAELVPGFLVAEILKLSYMIDRGKMYSGQ
ncbi:unnamed protein product, partial [Vitis vinifera]